MINMDNLPEGLNLDAWEYWIGYRKEMGFKKYKTNRTAKMLAALPYDDQMKCCKYSADREWQGLFPERFENNGETKKQSNFKKTGNGQSQQCWIKRGEKININPNVGEPMEKFKSRIIEAESRQTH